MLRVYVDGAYNPVLGQGGWGAVIVENSQKQVFSGMAKRTTSNRMEITAALEGISRTAPGSEVVLYTDSQYLFGCVTKGWQRRANRDLWERLDTVVSQRKVNWEWIDRNTQNPFHKEAHNMATTLASQSEEVQVVPSKQTEGQPEVPVGEGLTHVDALGRPRMVDITGKPDTQREAIAKCLVKMKASTLELLKRGNMPKGDVLAVAQLAGIMAAKQTPQLIPLCHPVLIGDIEVEFNLDEADVVEITSTVKSTGKTGVEMEALTATAVAALTIYDMCKAVDRGIQIDRLRLIKKSGGKSGTISLEQVVEP
jgi:cyclic pyranopterin phosphate synthase